MHVAMKILCTHPALQTQRIVRGHAGRLIAEEQRRYLRELSAAAMLIQRIWRAHRACLVYK